MGTEYDEFTGLADAVVQAFKDGTFNEPQPEIQKIRSGLMINFIRAFLPFSGMKELKEKRIDIRRTAIYFADRFEKWQNESKRKGGPDGEIIKGITLKELADCAGERFEEFSKAAGQAEINSLRHREMLERADYWRWTEQVIKEASDQQKKNH